MGFFWTVELGVRGHLRFGESESGLCLAVGDLS